MERVTLLFLMETTRKQILEVILILLALLLFLAGAAEVAPMVARAVLMVDMGAAHHMGVAVPEVVVGFILIIFQVLLVTPVAAGPVVMRVMVETGGMAALTL
jgi:hypothetical protein